jgi:branched-chain amino acid transport system ATP-binding protein
MVEPILTVSHLTIHYGSYAALKEATLDAYEDEILSIVGPNGAGKTTLLETIAGLRELREGEIRYIGKPINTLSVLQRRSMGIVLIPQDDNVFPNMSVKMNLEVSGILSPKVRKKNLIEYVFELFPRLEERKDQKAFTLSGGERKMLALGMGLVSDASTMLIDEPSIGLAPKLVTELFERLRDIKNDAKKTIVLAEQNIKVLNIIDRILGLEAGQTKFFENAHNLDRDNLVELYMGMEVRI